MSRVIGTGPPWSLKVQAVNRKVRYERSSRDPRNLSPRLASFLSRMLTAMRIRGSWGSLNAKGSYDNLTTITVL